MNYVLDCDVDLDGNALTDIFKDGFSKERNILNYIFGEDIVDEIISSKPRELFIPKDNLKCVLENLYKVKNIGYVTEYDIYCGYGDAVEVKDVDYLKNIYSNDGAVIAMSWVTTSNANMLYNYLDGIEIYTSDDSIYLMLSDGMYDTLSGF